MSDRTPRRRRRGSSDGAPVVPDAEFVSYYGRPVVKASPWEKDIPAYLFLGGLAAGSSLLAAGGAASDRPALRRHGRITAFAAISLSFAALVHDLGRPSRLLNMLRVIKPTSPMSVGTWLLAGYGPLAGAAALGELAGSTPRGRGPLRLLSALRGPAGVGATLIAPAVATYTAVLLSDTATPAWSAARKELPFVFAGSAAAAAGGLAMATVPVSQAAPARRMAVGGALTELAAQQVMERSMGLSSETLSTGIAGRWHRLARVSTGGGVVLALTGARSRTLSVLAGLALTTGSFATRFAIFEAGQASARDPRYTIVPQRERLDAAAGETPH
jgi:formate-dependent nitrite reductase membrane component NrfD